MASARSYNKCAGVLELQAQKQECYQQFWLFPIVVQDTRRTQGAPHIGLALLRLLLVINGVKVSRYVELWTLTDEWSDIFMFDCKHKRIT